MPEETQMPQRSARPGDGLAGGLGRWCFRHRRMTLLTWVLGIACLISLGADYGADPGAGGAPALGSGQLVGLLVVLAVLLAAFASPRAASLPVITASFGLGAGLPIIALIGRLVPAPPFWMVMAVVIGLGVGVDYALLIVTRFREAARGAAGRPLLGLPARPAPSPEAAAVSAMRSAGRPVLTAGGTVVIAVSGLLVLGEPFLDGVAVVVAVTVTVLVLSSLTVLPALLSWTGTRLGRPAGRERRDVALLARRPAARWWAATVQRRPALAAAAAVTVLLALAIPAAGLRLGVPDAAGPTRATADAAYVMLHRGPGPGPGLDAPVTMAAHLPRASPGRLGGVSLPGLIGIVVALAMLLLLAAFRSVAAAVTAAAMNLLSIAAAYGALTLVSRDGWAQRALGFPANPPVTAWVPVFLFVVLFGLSTDYQVFLLARVRAAFDAVAGLGAIAGGAPGAGGAVGGAPGAAGGRAGGAAGGRAVGAAGGSSAAVGRGLAGSARGISAGAAIMIAVFLAGVPGASVPVKQVGVGLAAAVLIDATLVRLVLAPAVMQILGEANWWLPRPLERLLPSASRPGDESPATRDRQPQAAD
jgi:uncharacterized membrane protein YdfJ with MMPL/SSD domain